MYEFCQVSYPFEIGYVNAIWCYIFTRDLTGVQFQTVINAHRGRVVSDTLPVNCPSLLENVTVRFGITLKLGPTCIGCPPENIISL